MEMGMLRAWLRSRRGGTLVVSSVLALAGACGRSSVDPGECREPEVEACVRDNGKPGVRQCFDGMWSECGRGSLPTSGSGGGGSGGQGGTAGRSSSGDAGRGGQPVAGAGNGGVAGVAPLGGEAGAGGEPLSSLYCDEGEQAVLYLLSDPDVLYRVDADTMETLGQVQVGISDVNSLAVTRNGTVYAASRLEIFRIDAFTGQAVAVGLDVSALDGDDSLTIGYAPKDPVLSGEVLLMAHKSVAGEVDLYAVSLNTFVPLWRHYFDGLDEYPEPLAAPNGRTFALLSGGFVEYDPGIYVELGTLPVPGLGTGWSGDSAYLSGYLFAIYGEDDGTRSRIYRGQVKPDLEDSAMQDLGTFPSDVIGAGAACLSRP
jgi:hypothetical protein